MRKAIRKLNKIIHQYLKKEIKEIKLTVLYKIVEATDEKFKNGSGVDEEITEKCSSTQLITVELKNSLLDYSYDDENSFDGHP